MDRGAFREQAHRMVDWMADYLERIEEFPVRSASLPGEIAAKLPAQAPEQAQDIASIMADFERDILPGVTHWQHPRFFAYFPANSSPPSVLAEMLMATVAAQGMLWQTSPAATEMEERVLVWLRQLMGLPEGLRGVIQDSASSAAICALVMARERATSFAANEQGAERGGLAVYASDQAHSSIEKGVKLVGLGRQAIRWVATDEARRMRPERLANAIRSDRETGATPMLVVATLGTTGAGSFDDLAAIGQVCREEGVFLHVDAAWAGSALILEEQRWMSQGMEAADSFCFNPHKWLMTNFDCSAHFVRDVDLLQRALTIDASYLEGPQAGRVIDYRDWGIPLGRRFRALKLWFVLRAYGAERLRGMLRDHIAWTAELARWIEAEPGFTLTSGPSLALLSFRHEPDAIRDQDALDDHNRRLVDAINDDGRIYLTPNRLDARTVIRVSIGARLTERRHVVECWDVIREIAGRL